VGSNQNVIFEFVVREISILPTLKASRELKNWYFTMNFFSKTSSSVNKNTYQILRPKDLPKKRYSKSTSYMCNGEIVFIANFDSLPKIELFFCYEIFGTKTSLC